MKEFMMLFRGGDALEELQTQEELQAHMGRWTNWIESFNDKSRLVSSQPFSPDGVVIEGMTNHVSHSPYDHEVEPVSGYLLCKAENLDEVVEMAKGCPVLEFADGTVEIRQVLPMDGSETSNTLTDSVKAPEESVDL